MANHDAIEIDTKHVFAYAKHVFAYANRGSVYQGKKDYDRPIALRQSGSALHKFAPAYYNRGQAYRAIELIGDDAYAIILVLRRFKWPT